MFYDYGPFQGSPFKGGMRDGMHDGMHDGFRRYPRLPGRSFIPVPIVIGPGYGSCYTYDKYGRCCDRYGRCCDRFGRCDTMYDYYGGNPAVATYDMMDDLDFL